MPPARRSPSSAFAAIAAAIVLFAGAVAAAAQEPIADARLDPPVRAEINRAVAEARSQGLPTEPLIDKAFEGAAKGAASSRIVAAVRTLASGLASARRQLGDATGPADLVAGAEALRAGVEPKALGALRRSRPNESLLMPLVVLADLISRGVPVDAASDAVLTLASRGASDAEFNAMQQEIHTDIQAGATPATAASIRSRGRGRSDDVQPPGQAKPPKGQAGGADKPGGAKPAAPGKPSGGKPSVGKPTGGKPAGPPGGVKPKPPGKPGGARPDGPPKRPPKSKPPKGDHSPPGRD